MNEKQTQPHYGCLKRILRVIAFIVIISVICGGIFYYKYTHPSEDGVCRDALTELTAANSTTTLLDYSKGYAQGTQPITFTNSDQLNEIERLGRGYVKEVFWQNDDLMVLTTVGLWRHSHTDWQAEPKLVWVTNLYVDDYAISDDGSLIAILADNGDIPILDASTGQVIQTLKYDPSRKSLSNVAFSSDNSMLAAAFGFEVQVWNLKASKMIQSFWDEKLYLVRSVAFSPNNQMLAVGGTRTVSIWSITSANKVIDIDTGDGAPRNIAFSADGTILATGNDYLPRYARFWDLKTSQLINKLPMSVKRPDGSAGLEFRVSYSSDGSRFAYGYLLWASGLDQAPIKMDIFDVRFNQAGTLVAGLPWSESPRLYDFEQYLDAASEGNIRIWDVENGKKLVELPDFYGVSPQLLTPQMTLRDDTPIFYFASSGAALAVQSKDGQIVIVASNPASVFPLPPPAVRVCDQAGTQIISFRMPISSWMIYDIVISPDGRFAALDTVNSVFVIDIEERSISQPIPYFVEGMAFSSDSSLLAVSYKTRQNHDFGIGIWGMQTQEELTVLKGHTSTLNAIRFVENDSLLLTYGHDGTIRFWGIPAHD